MSYLVVDTSLTMRRIVARALTSLGVPEAAITYVGTVGEALRVLDETPVELLVTNWDLPGGSGLEVIQHLRTARRSDAPALLITTKSLAEDVMAARDAGASDLIIRGLSFTPHLMRERLGELLAQPVR